MVTVNKSSECKVAKNDNEQEHEMKKTYKWVKTYKQIGVL
jgi:hypothetical protein